MPLSPPQTHNRLSPEQPQSPEWKSLVIVGGGMVCHRLCKQLVHEGYQTHQIKIFTEESLPPYDRANLSKCFHRSLKTPPLLDQKRWYEKNGISLHLSKKAAHLDASNKRIRFLDNSIIGYDKLVLATGSRPDIHAIEGAELENVFTYRNWQDLLKIESFCRPDRTIAVIGGGLLGLEAAAALHQAKCRIKVYETANTPLCRNLSETAGAVLLKSMKTLGIEVLLKYQLEKILSNNGKLNLVFRGNVFAEADGVVLATGTRPCDELAAESGIQVSPKGGFLVDETLSTSDPDIFALGDCASFRHDSFGFVQPAYEQADVLAARFCGKDETYVPTGRNCRLNIMGIELSAYGENLGEGEHLVYEVNGDYRSLVMHRGKLIGATTIGKWDQATALGVAVSENLRVPHRQKKHFCTSGQLDMLTHMGNVTTWSADAVICQCTHMSCQAVKNAISEGFDSLAKLEKYTQAGGQCGSCRPLLLGLLHPQSQEVQGQAEIPGHRKDHLWWVALVGLIFCMLFWAPWQMPPVDSVQSLNYKWSQFWNSFFAKQVTGFTTAGLSLSALILSLRKRMAWFQWGEFAVWRVLHACVGILTLLTLFLHTGLSMGHNLNFWLATCFVGLNTLGAFAAIASSSRARKTAGTQTTFQVWMTRLHIIFFWPYPVLLAAHVYKVYQY